MIWMGKKTKKMDNKVKMIKKMMMIKKFKLFKNQKEVALKKNLNVNNNDKFLINFDDFYIYLCYLINLNVRNFFH